jgi:hypothetical protein
LLPVAPVAPLAPAAPAGPVGPAGPAGPAGPVAPPPLPLPKQFWMSMYVKATVLLPSIDVVPAPEPSVWSKSGTIPVALVELVTVAVVSCVVKMNELGSDHLIFDVDPLNDVPVNVMTVPGHPVVGETDVRCHADAAWALPRNTNRPSVLAMRLIRLENRRARGSAWVPCMASLRLRIRSPPGIQ